jgi:hypothetical protein
MAEPDPSNVAPWYLRNINQALELNEATGQVFVRTGFEGNIIITGNVNIPGNVDAHISEIGTSGNLTVPWMPVSIDGNSNVTIAGGNVNAAVTGTVAVSGITGNIAGITGNVTVVDGGGSITVDGNVGITGNVNIGTMPNVNAAVTGTVAVSSITGNLAGITANVTVVDGGGSLTVDGNVNANITGGNVTVTQGTSPWVVSGNVGITGNANVALGGTNLDAFGRLRVSNPVTLFDSQNRYIDSGQFSNVTATGGNVVYVANESSFNLNVSTANGSSAVQQAKFVQPYQPGKSLLVMESFCMSTLIANCRQRVGYFTTENGIYFEADGTTLYLVIRSSASGSIVEERIAQSAWNGDRLNGVPGANNPSGITLNPALTNIFWTDIEWLGVGNVRAGFVINGQFILCHTFQHANQSGNTKVYMTTATLNPRYEITNTGTTASNSTLKQICSTVISEGGYTPATTQNYVSSGLVPTRISVSNAYVALASIRLNPAYPDAVVVPAQLDLLLTDVRYGQFQLVLNASNVVANTGSWSNVANSVVQTNSSALQIGDGTVLFGGVTSSRDTLTVTEDVKARLQLSRQANGTPDILTLCVGYTSTNADVLWRLGWEEVTN